MLLEGVHFVHFELDWTAAEMVERLNCARLLFQLVLAPW
jgi:hypothetical protein